MKMIITLKDNELESISGSKVEALQFCRGFGKQFNRLFGEREFITIVRRDGKCEKGKDCEMNGQKSI